ncbi:hypothetical protein GCG54_00005975 [Colletotrichum gloeosporioides]|uniref:Uncharacterized protein n=2 Tax=Colletotrichum gloeosporioides TaxID=474922 RepID=T0K800_COLGC|nr:uncharacterized protein GCG54_00005975 [Colletotrichum gloeosporioides]EQB48139.1 hypothetical protein CGLO_12661 [Colletotrichum gloeosporioides Cg-14]KAF3806213.1 hypothetical protein GCG54_00005975 [Colletotrichum gloeosporioides]
MATQTSQEGCDRCPWQPDLGLRRSIRVHVANQHRQGLGVKPDQPLRNQSNTAEIQEPVNDRPEGLIDQPEVLNVSIEEDTDQSNRSTPETEAGSGATANAGRVYQNNFYNSTVYNFNM